MHWNCVNRNLSAQMQTLTESLLTLGPPGGICDETALRNLFPEATIRARRLLVYRAVQAGGLIRLKPVNLKI